MEFFPGAKSNKIFTRARKWWKIQKFENFRKSSEINFEVIPEQVFLFLIILHGAKHSPLLLGVWVTEGRILEVQRKFMGLSFVTQISQKLRITMCIWCKNSETTRYRLHFDGIVASRLWNFSQERSQTKFSYEVKNYEKMKILKTW